MSNPDAPRSRAQLCEGGVGEQNLRSNGLSSDSPQIPQRGVPNDACSCLSFCEIRLYGPVQKAPGLMASGGLRHFCNVRALLCFIGCVIGVVHLFAWRLTSVDFPSTPGKTVASHQRPRNSWPLTAQLDPRDRIAPLQFQYQLCNGLTNQRLQMIDGILVGLFLGAQVVLPETMQWNGAQFVDVQDSNVQPLSRILNLRRLEREVRKLYSRFWCRRKNATAQKVWCGKLSMPAIVYNSTLSKGAMSAARFETIAMNEDRWREEELLKMGEKIWQHISMMDKSWLWKAPSRIVRISEKCEFWFKVQVTEGSEMWPLFWEINNALDFSDEVMDVAQAMKRQVLYTYGPAARRKAELLGYGFEEDSLRQGAYHVVHLRAEEDWKRHCSMWTSAAEKRDNCMNNTFEIGNVLLSEGVNPALPIYLATGLSPIELLHLKNSNSFPNFFNIFTVVTKDMLKLSDFPAIDEQHREYWAAADFVMSQDSEIFIGNSVSTFSALVLEIRQILNRACFHYNGGKMPLEEIDLLRPKVLTVVSPIRSLIKWVFTVPDVELHDDVYNDTLVAVRSALAKTSVVPVCVTTADPHSDVAVRLVSMGVRVIYHKPAWVRNVHTIIEAWNQKATKSWYQHVQKVDAKQVTSRLLRIDIPLLGILDQFVLFTDTGVMFTGEVAWSDLIGGDARTLIRLLRRKMFGQGSFTHFAQAGHVGVPRYFSATGGMTRSTEPGEADTGVSLLNLQSLRDSYDEYLKFLFKHDNLLHFGPADPCGYLEFYIGQNHVVSLLPFPLNWKPFWEPNRRAQIVHFLGPKCNTDILPFLRHGTVRFEPFRSLLDKCASEGDCEQVCRQYQDML